MCNDATTVSWPVAGATAPAMSGSAPRGAADATMTDEALVAASLDGTAGAFDVLVTRHRRAVYQVCYRFVNNHEDAADLTQDTFVRAWKALGGFRGQARFSTWVHRIAVNVSLNRVSLKTPRAETIDFDTVADTREPAPGQSLVDAERDTMVRAAVAALPPRQRTALILRIYHELSHQEVAAIVGTSVGAVKANVFHALANLRKRLGSSS
ncbi:MAG: sigma-70 family RNA polymerase sigma factor [Acidobacteriota bacterium]